MMFGGVTCKLFPSREGYKDNRHAEGLKNNGASYFSTHAKKQNESTSTRTRQIRLTFHRKSEEENLRFVF